MYLFMISVGMYFIMRLRDDEDIDAIQYTVNILQLIEAASAQPYYFNIILVLIVAVCSLGEVQTL